MSLDLLFRATSKRALFKLGKTLGFIEGLDGDPPTLSAFAYDHGVNVALFGKGAGNSQVYVVEPATYDVDGEVVTPAVVDDTHIYANIRLVPPAQLLDKIAGSSDGDDLLDKSKIARWLKNNGVATDVVSVYPGGPVRRRFVKDLAGGDVIELIWPAPQFPRQAWAGG